MKHNFLSISLKRADGFSISTKKLPNNQFVFGRLYLLRCAGMLA